MSVLGDELKRVVKFAEGLGLKVKFLTPDLKDYHGLYSHPDRHEKGLIEVCRNAKTSKTFQIITLLHEIGHHIDFTENRMVSECYSFLDPEAGKAPEWARKAIFNSECRAVKYGEKLYWTLMLKIPFWKVKQELACDIFVYRTFLKTSDFPNTKQVAEFKKRWAKRNKKRYLGMTAHSSIISEQTGHLD